VRGEGGGGDKAGQWNHLPLSRVWGAGCPLPWGDYYFAEAVGRGFQYMYTQPAAMADLAQHWTAVVKTLAAAGECRARRAVAAPANQPCSIRPGS
jgi:hypothetical protein